MKYLIPSFLVVVLISLVSLSCLKSGDKGCQALAPETEEPQMTSFCNTHQITYTKHSSGLYYQIIDSGYGTAPTTQAVVSVAYTGTLLNGTVIDQQTTPATFRMDNLIGGWRVGLPLIKKGGRIKLIIPSYLGYGCTAMTKIPANSVLYFDITLADVQ